jgi:hypothetical protein
VATWNSADRNNEQIEINRRVAAEGEARIRAELVRQVQDIHTWMREASDEFHKGNEDSAVTRKTLTELVQDLDHELGETEKQLAGSLENQTHMLANQGQMLENQTNGFKSQEKLLQEIRQKTP